MQLNYVFPEVKTSILQTFCHYLCILLNEAKLEDPGMLFMFYTSYAMCKLLFDYQLSVNIKSISSNSTSFHTQVTTLGAVIFQVAEGNANELAAC